jgi:hypothetical protein
LGFRGGLEKWFFIFLLVAGGLQNVIICLHAHGSRESHISFSGAARGIFIYLRGFVSQDHKHFDEHLHAQKAQFPIYNIHRAAAKILGQKKPENVVNSQLSKTDPKLLPYLNEAAPWLSSLMQTICFFM